MVNKFSRNFGVVDTHYFMSPRPQEVIDLGYDRKKLNTDSKPMDPINFQFVGSRYPQHRNSEFLFQLSKRFREIDVGQKN